MQMGRGKLPTIDAEAVHAGVTASDDAIILLAAFFNGLT
jgi:hypothetical protein